jgi:hypothetical protein
MREALERFDRPATVISESPDRESSDRIQEILYASTEVGRRPSASSS